MLFGVRAPPGQERRPKDLSRFDPRRIRMSLTYTSESRMPPRNDQSLSLKCDASKQGFWSPDPNSALKQTKYRA